jgi:hypothetical protein
VLHAVHEHGNLSLGVKVQLLSRLSIHTGTYFRVSLCSSNECYEYKCIQAGTSSWVALCRPAACYAYTQVPTLEYSGVALLQTVSHKDT